MSKIKEDINVLRVIANYQINEVPSLIKNILIVSLWVCLFISIFSGFNFAVNYFTDSAGITENGNVTILISFQNEVNRLSSNYFFGKVGIWGSVIFIGLIIFAKFDEDWFKNNPVILRVPVLSWKLIILVSIVILILGFVFKLLNNYIVWGIFLIFVGSPLKLVNDDTFIKVSKRVYPDLNDGEKIQYP